MMETIPAMFMEQASRLGRKALFWSKRDGQYHPITWEQARETVQALRASLLNLPVNPGDRVVILSENRPEWGIADLAIQGVRAWTVPIYPSLTERDILYICKDCEPVACVASTIEQAQKIRAIRQHLPWLRLLIVMDAISVTEGETSWVRAIEQGTGLQSRFHELLERRIREVDPQDTATIIYTSGTTGEPKGVMLSHQNFLSNAASSLRVIPIQDTDVHLSFLPLSHVFERMAGWYLMLKAGASVAYAENMDTIPANMLEIRPTVMLGVPRFFEKLYTRVQDGLRQASPLKRRLAQWALSVGQQAGRCQLQRRPFGWGLRLRYAIAKALVFRKFHHRLGGRLRFFVSGSAPLPKHIGEFFFSVGVTILEGYGLTETSPVIAVNRLQAPKFGTVGLPLDDVEVRIAEDSEILTRGPHVMQGYYRKPQETQAAVTEGWFHTGDIGQLDGDGFLMITDRKKDLIKTAGGKFVAPQKLENLFVTDPFVSQALVFGDRERYCVALIVPNLQRLREYATTQGRDFASVQDLISDPVIHAFMWDRIQVLQRELASFEQVKVIALLDQEFSQAAGELTPTLKAKRAAIAARYQDLLQRLYQSAPPSSSHPAGSLGDPRGAGVSSPAHNRSSP